MFSQWYFNVTLCSSDKWFELCQASLPAKCWCYCIFILWDAQFSAGTVCLRRINTVRHQGFNSSNDFFFHIQLWYEQEAGWPLYKTWLKMSDPRPTGLSDRRNTREALTPACQSWLTSDPFLTDNSECRYELDRQQRCNVEVQLVNHTYIYFFFFFSSYI